MTSLKGLELDATLNPDLSKQLLPLFPKRELGQGSEFYTLDFEMEGKLLLKQEVILYGPKVEKLNLTGSAGLESRVPKDTQ